MELILEFVFELIFEGTIDLSVNKKVPWPLRMLACLILLVVYGGLLSLLGYVGVSLMQEGNAVGGVIFIIVDVFLAVMCVWGVARKYREHRH